MDLIINFTPNGMIPTKALTPHVPVSVAEIVDDVHRAVEIGITMAHLHARDEETGKPTYRADLYGRIIEGIRSYAPDLIICVSLSGRTFPEFEQRADPLRLDGAAKPDMGSLTLGSLNFNREPSVNSPEMILALAREMQSRGIRPELEAFDLGMINHAKYLATKGVLRAPYYFNLLLGNIAGAQPDLLHVGMMVRDLPARSIWSLAGLGDAQLMMNSLAIASGGGVRVGLEDNIWFDLARTRLASNADLLGRIHAIAQANERSVMAPAQLRQLLELQPGYGAYGAADR
jgi:3-keto-5-aminohexanoate cleavage enzyme